MGAFNRDAKSLAVWWMFGGSFIGPCEPVDGPHVTQHGRYLQLDYDHFSVWDDVNPLGLGAEYDELPRGRVTFDSMLHKFVVVGPAALVDDMAFRKRIRDFYDLPETAIFKSDEWWRAQTGAALQ